MGSHSQQSVRRLVEVDKVADKVTDKVADKVTDMFADIVVKDFD